MLVKNVYCIDCNNSKPNVYALRCRKCNDIHNSGVKNNKYIHGLSKTKFYSVWYHMIDRCYNKNDKGYKNYGGRGIRVEWKSFEDFRDDMYENYLEHKKNNLSTTIERINVNGNYCKDNCCWATKTEQGKNKTDILYLTYKGVTRNLSEWSRITNIKYSRIYNRYKKNWSANKILSNKKYGYTQNSH